MSKSNLSKIKNQGSIDMKFTKTAVGGPMPAGAKCESEDKPKLDKPKLDKPKTEQIDTKKEK